MEEDAVRDRQRYKAEGRIVPRDEVMNGIKDLGLASLERDVLTNPAIKAEIAAHRAKPRICHRGLSIVGLANSQTDMPSLGYSCGSTDSDSAIRATFDRSEVASQN